MAQGLDKDVTIIHLISSSGFFGAEHVVTNLSKATINLPNHHSKILVFCICRDEESIAAFADSLNQQANIEFHTLPLNLNQALGKIRQVLTPILNASARESSGTNIMVHTHGYKELIWAHVLRIWFKFPIVNTQHGFINNSLKGKAYNLLGILACRSPLVKRVYCVTDAIRKIYLGHGIKSNKLVIFPNAIPLDSQQSSDISTEENKTTLVFVGRLSKEKNPLLFLRVVQELIHTNQSIQALIIGEGPLAAEVDAYIKTHQLHPYIKCLGFRNDAKAIIAKADILAITSTTEGIPLVALEAMATNTLIVSTAVGGMCELLKPINHNLTGVLVKVEDKTSAQLAKDFAHSCKNLLSNAVLQQQISKAARNKIEREHSIGLQAETLLQTYRQLAVG